MVLKALRPSRVERFVKGAAVATHPFGAIARAKLYALMGPLSQLPGIRELASFFTETTTELRHVIRIAALRALA